MTPEKTAAHRTQLLEQRAGLLAQIAQQRGGVIGRAEVANDHFAGTQESQAQTASEREIEFALGEHETAELNAIDAALKRLDDGSYGLCLACGTHIPSARLQAAPAALRCLACQEQAEHKH